MTELPVHSVLAPRTPSGGIIGRVSTGLSRDRYRTVYGKGDVDTIRGG